MIEAPVPFGNAASRWSSVLLKGLVARGHHVSAFAACSKASEMAEAARLFPKSSYDLQCYPFPNRRGVQGKLATVRRPYSYMFSPDFRSSLQRTIDDGVDIVHVEQLWTGWCCLQERSRTLMSVHYLASIDLADVKGGGIRGLVGRTLMKRAERRLLRSFNFFRACSSRLVPPITTINPQADVVNVPLGLESSLYRYVPDGGAPAVPTVGLIGTMSWYPSYSAAVRLITRLWPAIKRRVPSARLRVGGWSARSALKDYIGQADVEIVEAVSDVEFFFSGLSVFLYAPARGSGMKIKVSEAMAFGVAVVTTHEGVEGLPAEHGIHASIADDDEALIDCTVRLLEDASARNRQRAAGRALIETHCSPERTVTAIEEAYSRIVCTSH